MSIDEILNFFETGKNKEEVNNPTDFGSELLYRIEKCFYAQRLVDNNLKETELIKLKRDVLAAAEIESDRSGWIGLSIVHLWFIPLSAVVEDVPGQSIIEKELSSLDEYVDSLMKDMGEIIDKRDRIKNLWDKEKEKIL